MMLNRFPLSAKILLWFVLNLILLGLLLYALLLAQFGLGQDWLPHKAAGRYRMVSASEKMGR